MNIKKFEVVGWNEVREEESGVYEVEIDHDEVVEDRGYKYGWDVCHEGLGGVYGGTWKALLIHLTSFNFTGTIVIYARGNYSGCHVADLRRVGDYIPTVPGRRFRRWRSLNPDPGTGSLHTSQTQTRFSCACDSGDPRPWEADRP